MGFGTGLFLVAVGAIMRFAVDVQSNGFDVHMVGVILMITGAVAMVFSLLFWSTWGGFHRHQVVDGPQGRQVVDEYQSPVR